MGDDIAIKDLLSLICEIVGFEGEITHDLEKPDGTPRKLLDVGKLHDLGWKHEIELREGIEKLYAWYTEHRDNK